MKLLNIVDTLSMSARSIESDFGMVYMVPKYGTWPCKLEQNAIYDIFVH